MRSDTWTRRLVVLGCQFWPVSATRRQVGPDTGALSVWSLPYLEIVSPVSAFLSSGSAVCLHGRNFGRCSAVTACGRLQGAGGSVLCPFSGLAERTCSSFRARGLALGAPCRPGRAFAKCLLNFGLRSDRPAGIRHRQPMGDRQLRTVACDVTQRQSAL